MRVNCVVIEFDVMYHLSCSAVKFLVDTLLILILILKSLALFKF